MSNAAQLTASAELETGSVEDFTNEESRWNSRRSTHLAGVVKADGLASRVNCIVSDSSSTGAKLEVDPRSCSSEYAFTALPNKFWLFIKLDRTQVQCEVVWRAGSRMGVKFLSPMQSVPREPRSRLQKPEPESKSKLGWPFRKSK